MCIPPASAGDGCTAGEMGCLASGIEVSFAVSYDGAATRWIRGEIDARVTKCQRQVDRDASAERSCPVPGLHDLLVMMADEMEVSRLAERDFSRGDGDRPSRVLAGSTSWRICDCGDAGC